MRRALAVTSSVAVFAMFAVCAGAQPGTAEDHVPAKAEPASYPSLHLLGFTDLDYSATDERGLPSNSGFFEGQFVLHFTSLLSQRFTFVGEVSLSARPQAATEYGAGFNTEVERTILKYNRSDRLKLSVGRFHTPISYWNVAFHHGAWLQTTVARPDLIRFGGSFLPVHFVGALAEGAGPGGGLNLNYNLGIGNGRSSVASRGGDAGDVNNNRALIGTLFVKPNKPFGLQAGGAVYVDKFTRGAESYRELIASAHVAWTKETPELIAEYAWVRHRPLGRPGELVSRGYYVQAAYRLKAFKARLKPYVRYEELRLAAGDPVFEDMRARKGALVGARLDVSDLVALKAEYRRQRHPAEPYVNGAFCQISFSF
jgi:hypothetical protein